jgi:hypothetical protein
MTGTKGLYALTLALAGAAGFSSGWAARPQEERYLTLEEMKLKEYERYYRLTPEERASLAVVLGDYAREIDFLAKEFDRKYEAQVGAVKDKYDAKILAICSPEKHR